MIIRTRRKKESLFRRIFGRARAVAPESLNVMEPPQFRRELIKEIDRANRRAANREFGLIQLVFPDGSSAQATLFSPDLVDAFRNRLRVSDSIGWFDSNLSFLLPETDRGGTLGVANALADIARENRIEIDTVVSIYPWDDQLIALADELKESMSDDDPHSDGGSSRSHDGQAAGGNEFRSSMSDEPVAISQVAGPGVIETNYPFVESPPTPRWKRAIDMTGAGVGLLILAPVFALAAMAIKLTSRGPVLFVQQREGKDGRQFGILKFRTMIVGAEQKQTELRERNQQDGPAFKLDNDPRITPVGRYLRKTCVDELPQLINVLVGDMSLVGPRPLPTDESFACTSWQRSRLTVLPGLTCTWQVRSQRDVKFDEWMRMDLSYIERQSFWVDLKLIVATAILVLRHKGSV